MNLLSGVISTSASSGGNKGGQSIEKLSSEPLFLICVPWITLEQ